MLHSHIKIWIHLIWATKNHNRVFNNDISQKLAMHMINKANNEISKIIQR